MKIEIETPRDEEAIVEAVLFYDKVNAGRAARWEANRDLQVPMLTGENLGAKVCANYLVYRRNLRR